MISLSNPLYITDYGAAYVGDSLELLSQLEANSIDLVITSPPFALQREKTYGNVNQEAYVDWLFRFCEKVYHVLSPTGSFVIDLGGAYQSKRSLYNYRILIKSFMPIQKNTIGQKNALQDMRLEQSFQLIMVARYPLICYKFPTIPKVT